MKISRMKLAELTSGIGALVLGMGLGSYFSEWIQKGSVGLLFIGAVLHSWGMFNKHQLEKRENAVFPFWEKALYWVCWFLLAIIIIYITA